MTSRPLGRRPGDPDDTRADILDAARRLFAAAGFDRATIRAIGAEAGVDPSLVLHHFGSKQGLFVAAHDLPIDPTQLVGELEASPPEERGERLARIYLSALGEGSPALSLIRAAATNADAARMVREFVHSSVLVHAPWLAPGPDSELRLALAVTQMIGLLVARHIVELEVVRGAGTEQLVAAVAPTIQRYLDGGS